MQDFCREGECRHVYNSLNVTSAEAIKLLTKRTGRIRNVASVEDRTYSGRVYHSKAERNYAFGLDKLKAAGRIKDWQPQVPFSISVLGVFICKVVIDFGVEPIKGNLWYVEIKGVETEIYKLKRKLLKACYPTLDYRVIRA